MSFTIVAVIFTGIAASFALIMANREDRGMTAAIGAVWVIAAAIAFNLPERSLIFVALGFVLAIAGAASPRGAVILYLGVLAALPVSMTYKVPFPGLNFLISLDHIRLATLVLLGPVFVRAMFEKAPRENRNIERLLLFFTLLTGVMSIRDLPFTSMMRMVTYQFLLIYMPFVAVSRTLKTKEDMNHALSALFASFLIMAMIGAISALRSWNYYAALADYGSGKDYFDYRNGFLRVGATMMPALLAFTCAGGFLLALRARARKLMPAPFFFGAAAIFAFTAFATGARGGWLAAILCVVTYFVFLHGGAVMRKLYYATGVIMILAGFFLIFSGSSLLNDEYGTFSYRAELIRTSVEQVKVRPLFGSSAIYELPSFQHLRQGEGIIDLVNGYVFIVLFYGLVGLGVFLGVNYLAMKRGLKELSLMPEMRVADPVQQDLRRGQAFLLALQVSYLALIATISLVNQLPNYGYLILALVVAHANMASAERNAAGLSKSGAGEAPPLEPGESNIKAPPLRDAEAKPVPYGARFVRRF
ncbi:O-antigen ligase family protein [Hyphococcus luteus]|uniref:O-antigen ligase-related domain-containing protein n=1 Tax=Hyphococcus luteus TaxID=2058213 RepID=A0A2S7K7U1_9PROT|nr:O-antigen ligase family protein [Marinicaulis flavus]PQA88538.1 hypothetical protein CW354_09660 [Marinicaulis flavus]